MKFEPLKSFASNEVFYFAVIIPLILVVIAFTWLRAIRNSQLAPHHITQWIGTTKLDDFWTTNPVYLTYTLQTVPTTNGLEFHRTYYTNYYWHVWGIFR